MHSFALRRIMGVLIVDCTRAAIQDKFQMLQDNFDIRNDVTNYSPGKVSARLVGESGVEIF